MNLNPTRTRDYLKQFDFKNLFTDQLGWEQHRQTLPIQVEGQAFTLNAIAEKRGMVAYQCAASDGQIPPYNVRRQIEQRVAKLVREHLVIYTDRAQTTQVWQWVKREQGKPLASREQTWHKSQSGDLLIQKLDALVFTLAEEEQGIGLFDVVTRVRTGFDVERITKKFYDRFKTEHDRFLKMVEGIPDEELAKWYASVMLNRLMFIYFVQKKGFLNGDINYLRNRLRESKKRGKDKFYREFLLPLFFKGFAQKKRDDATNRLLGNVPYLNGGLFTEHYIESLHGKTIAVADSAFEKIFAFFDEYQWHLDDRPLRDDKEINPDVLGYIFEKYINQKQMGAYYTKEDITGYISQNTILPFLFDAARIGAIHELPLHDPDRYIYDAVKHGTTLDLPANIAAGIADVSKRTDWNKAAPSEYALPTEIWREVVARRQRYVEVKRKLANGEITGINDFITYNLNIRQFAQDAIQNADDPKVLRAFWDALTSVSVLDPTCGSGAFLFAALNILEPLYEACLERMQAIVEEDTKTFEVSETSKVSNAKFQKFPNFRDILTRVAHHPNRAYFIYKSIIVNNLYGVDIMEEAIEICKLRLFLKLVAQIDSADKIEPLPDIDFNIRAGNTLVGFATRAQVEQAIKFSQAGQMRMLSTEDVETMKKIDERAEIADRAFQQFRLQQTELGGEVTAADKENLRKRLKDLDDELNQYLAKQYGVAVGAGSPRPYNQWLASHKPFHWFVEFYGILKRGGFDVIIGNPPYVEYSKVKKEYLINGYDTESCGNLYANVIERCYDILRENGLLGMIVQLPIVCTDRMKPLQKECLSLSNNIWFANFDDRPAKLFDGLEHIRATIFIASKGTPKKSTVLSTLYNRWYTETRPMLFGLLAFENVSDNLMEGAIPKMGTHQAKRVRQRISHFAPLSKNLLPSTRNIVYFHNAPQYWIRAMTFIPYFWNEREGEQISTQVKSLYLSTKPDASVVAAVLNSSLFYWWFILLSDCRHLNLREIQNFPLGLDSMLDGTKKRLTELTDKLMTDLKKNKYRKEAYYQATGKVIYDEFYPKYSKPIIDQIDRVLAQHYGFTDEELDFIINYDIKYRMGKDGGEEEE